AGVPAAEARCSVDAVFKTLTDNQIRDLYQRGNGGTPKDDPNDTNDAANRLTEAMGKCRDAASTTTTSEGVGPAPETSTTTVPTPTTTVPGASSTSGPAFTATDGSSASTTVPTGSNGLSPDTTTSAP
ncbi:MAG: hypothetical protein ACR2MB_12860, partial [Acidimicrobiales bacterium]